MTELVSYEFDGGIASITMDDGKVNALSVSMLQEIHAALDQAERDSAVVVLSGREKYFSAGFDLKVFTEQPDRIVEMLTLGATLSERMLSFPRPVITACTGHSIAAGSFLQLAVDLRIGTEGPFKLGLNEVRIGLTVPLFVIELARQRLDPVHFNQAVISATMYGPQEAVAAGFLDQVVPAKDLRSAALSSAEELAGLDPRAHAATKLRARADAIKAVRSAIETELNVESLEQQARP